MRILSVFIAYAIASGVGYAVTTYLPVWVMMGSVWAVLIIGFLVALGAAIRLYEKPGDEDLEFVHETSIIFIVIVTILNWKHIQTSLELLGFM